MNGSTMKMKNTPSRAQKAAKSRAHTHTQCARKETNGRTFFQRRCEQSNGNIKSFQIETEYTDNGIEWQTLSTMPCLYAWHTHTHPLLHTFFDMNINRHLNR